MYCSNCGSKATGNFCASCGSALQASAAGQSTASAPHIPQAAAPGDWSEELRVDALLRVPEVRELVSKHAAQAAKRMTGEQFLDVCGKALEPFGLAMGGGVSMGKVAEVAQPIYARMGIGTGKTRAQVFARPAGGVLVALLCSLARNGRTLRQASQAEDGCVIEAAIPSDMWSFEGDLLVTVQRRAEGTFVEAATKIKGQLFDWGKSKQLLDELFTDLTMTPVAI
jgi:hypothetical protein